MLKNKLVELETINKEVIKKEWSNVETAGVNEILFQLFKNEEIKNHNGKLFKIYTRSELENIFGLPYTSSSSYAMLSMDCNNYIIIDNNYHFSHVVIYNQDVMLVTQDKEENEKYYLIIE